MTFNPYRAFRQLERLVFRGVSEQPEPLWSRDGNAHVPERITGRSQLGLRTPAESMSIRHIATVVYRPAVEEVWYQRPDARDTQESRADKPKD